MTENGEVRRQCAGNFVSVEPGGQSLLVELKESPNTKLVRVPLNGGAEQQIPGPGPLTLAYAIDHDGVRNGRLVAPGSSPTWYWPPAISTWPPENRRAFRSTMSATSTCES